MATAKEDCIASDEILASPDDKTNEELNCPLCLNLFRLPRQLPCAHSFCEACLQSHISKSVLEKQSCEQFHCPICESKVNLPAKHSVGKCASFFPVSAILLYMLFKDKTNGKIMCDACNSEKISTHAEEYCLDCNEAMCIGCMKFHRKQRILKDHKVIRIDDIINKPEIVTKFGSYFRCNVHANETLTHTCKSHLVPLCSICIKVNHKNCSNVTRLEEESARLLNQLDLSQITQTIKKCEDEVAKLLAENLKNFNNLKSQAKEMIDQISDLRKQINEAFDDLEKKLQQYAETICKEEEIKMQGKDRNCQSLKAAMKNSQFLYEAVNKYGTDEQKYILARKIKKQTFRIQKKIDHTRTQNETLNLQLEINPKLKWMLAIPTSHLASVKVRRQEGEFIVSDKLKPVKFCDVKLMDTLAVGVLKTLTNVVYISESSIIFNDRNHCHIFDLSSKISTEYCMPEGCDDASNICITGDNELAVSFPTLRAVFLFSVFDTKLSVKANFKTRQSCSGVIAVSREEIIVSGQCNDGKHFYWSLYTLYGKEKSYHEFVGHGESNTCIALNSRKTLLYIVIRNGDSLHCFGMDGTVYYHITPTGLVSAAGLALDRDDNVYVVGKKPGSIFQISPDGEVLKIFTEGIPLSLSGICFNPTGDKFICIRRVEAFTRLKHKIGLQDLDNLYLFELI